MHPMIGVIIEKYSNNSLHCSIYQCLFRNVEKMNALKFLAFCLILFFLFCSTLINIFIQSKYTDVSHFNEMKYHSFTFTRIKFPFFLDKIQHYIHYLFV